MALTQLPSSRDVHEYGEYIQKFDPQKRVNTECSINDDVTPIWRKTWNAEILHLFIPTYGGLPPAQIRSAMVK
jgi:multimeric flavodoxin WrbA